VPSPISYPRAIHKQRSYPLPLRLYPLKWKERIDELRRNHDWGITWLNRTKAVLKPKKGMELEPGELYTLTVKNFCSAGLTCRIVFKGRDGSRPLI